MSDFSAKFDTLSDEELVKLSSVGEKGAFDALFHRFSSLIKKTIRPYFLLGGDDEDLMQEGMIGLFKAINDFSPDKDCQFKQFALLCIKRQVLTAVKTASRKKHSPLNSYVSISNPLFDNNDLSLLDLLGSSSDGNPENIVIGKEVFDDVLKKMDKLLSKFERKVISLYLDGLGYQQIASVLEREPKSIDNALQRIKHKLSGIK